MTKKQKEIAHQLLSENTEYNDVIFATVRNEGQFEDAIAQVEEKHGDNYKLVTKGFGTELYFLIHTN